MSKSPVTPPKAYAEPIATPARLWWLMVLALVFAIGNIAMPPAMFSIDPPGPPILQHVFCTWEIGGVFAQLLILGFFAVLGPGSNLPRQIVVWFVSAILIGSFASGVGFAAEGAFIDPRNFLLVPLFAVPAVLSACQAPLWALRYFARWRTSSSQSPTQDSGQISIRGMLAATAVVAIVLGLCRLGLSMENLRLGGGRYGQPLPTLNWWIGVGIASAIAIVFSAVVLPVSSLFVLRSQSAFAGVLCAAGYLAGCTLAFSLILSLFGRAAPTLEGCFVLLLLYLSITTYLLASLAIFRWAGYRLWWGRGTLR